MLEMTVSVAATIVVTPPLVYIAIRYGWWFGILGLIIAGVLGVSASTYFQVRRFRQTRTPDKTN